MFVTNLVLHIKSLGNKRNKMWLLLKKMGGATFLRVITILVLDFEICIMKLFGILKLELCIFGIWKLGILLKGIWKIGILKKEFCYLDNEKMGYGINPHIQIFWSNLIY